MLTYLAIENIALVDSLTLSFDSSFTVLTGESGAGKSVLLDCLQFVAGSARSRAELGLPTRDGRVEAQFHLSAEETSVIREKLEAHGIPVEDELVLRRTLDGSGRSRCFVQGHLVPRQLLAEVAGELLEFTNQGDSLSLRSARQQLELVDDAVGLGKDREEFGRLFAEFSETKSALEYSRARVTEGEARRDFVEYQLAELRNVAVESYDEDVELVRRYDALRERSEIVEELLSDLGRGEDAILRRLYALRRRTESLFEDPELASALETALDAIETAESRLSSALETSESSPTEIERRRARATRVEDLARKHRTSIGELGEKSRRLATELEELATHAERVDVLEVEVRGRRENLDRLARELHEARRSACLELGRRATAELGALGLGDAELSFEVTETPLGSTGTTAVSILYSSHSSLPPKSLAKIASGGELGRVLLALRLGTKGRRPLLVLDEIDAGVGGQAAGDIAEVLGRAAGFGQLLVVTHWPQVAAAASQHIALAKQESGGRVCSVAEVLTGSRRIAELARMLGGACASAEEHARSLLAPSRTDRKGRARLREVA